MKKTLLDSFNVDDITWYVDAVCEQLNGALNNIKKIYNYILTLSPFYQYVKKEKLNYLISVKRLYDGIYKQKNKVNDFMDAVCGFKKMPKENKAFLINDYENFKVYKNKVNEILQLNNLVDEIDELKDLEKILINTSKNYNPEFGEILDMLKEQQEGGK